MATLAIFLRFSIYILEVLQLIDYKNQVVTVSDLVLKTQLSPSKCQKFLDKLVVELDGEISYTETGKLYYKFPTAENLKPFSDLNYKSLIRSTEFVLKYNEGIVTVADLVLKTELSPRVCQLFLNEFIKELNGEIRTTESGQVYYQFPTAQNIELLRLKESN